MLNPDDQHCRFVAVLHDCLGCNTCSSSLGSGVDRAKPASKAEKRSWERNVAILCICMKLIAYALKIKEDDC